MNPSALQPTPGTRFQTRILATLLGLGLLGHLNAQDSTWARTPYKGWKEAWHATNQTSEVFVVPEVGRVMQFKFIGGAEGPFWENPKRLGSSPNPKSKDWGNFGGDKTWPSPQADWGKVTDRDWPPPPAFDSMPVDAHPDGPTLVLISKVDPFFGIRTERRIRLHSSEPRMEIETIYTKTNGNPLKTGIWVITQLKDPEAVAMPIPPQTLFKDGYVRQSDQLPDGLHQVGRVLLMKRAKIGSFKVGNDTGTLLWIGRESMVLIESSRNPNGEYPDSGSSAEVYTNPDPDAYVELELLGPLATMKPGDRMTQTSRYSLLKRTGRSPEVEALTTLRGN